MPGGSVGDAWVSTPSFLRLPNHEEKRPFFLGPTSDGEASPSGEATFDGEATPGGEVTELALLPWELSVHSLDPDVDPRACGALLLVFLVKNRLMKDGVDELVDGGAGDAGSGESDDGDCDCDGSEFFFLPNKPPPEELRMLFAGFSLVEVLSCIGGLLFVGHFV